jgi:hypothetical protein
MYMCSVRIAPVSRTARKLGDAMPTYRSLIPFPCRNWLFCDESSRGAGTLRVLVYSVGGNRT